MAKTVRLETYFPYDVVASPDSAPRSGPMRRERLSRKIAAYNDPKLKRIPPRAVMIPLPNVPQPDGISCGDATMLSILLYFAVGKQKIAEIKEEVKTTRKDGTYYLNIVHYANKLGLRAMAIKKMTLERLERCIEKGWPVICSIQAYGAKPQDYVRNDMDNGHYVVAIGFDKDNLYFMDPSAPAWDRRRGWVRKREFVRRWHDDEGMNGNVEIIYHLGIVIHPKPKHTAFLTRAHKIQ
jgi:predicted double-glycine peptidase